MAKYKFDEDVANAQTMQELFAVNIESGTTNHFKNKLFAVANQAQLIERRLHGDLSGNEVAGKGLL